MGHAASLPPMGIAALAIHLLRHTNRIRQHPGAGSALTEIRDAARRAQRVLDRPEDQSFLGVCDNGDCARPLYVTPATTAFTCRCGQGYTVAARREQLLAAAAGMLGTATEISRALTGLGTRDVTPARIRAYAHRGRLAAHGTDAHTGWPLYRVADVQAIIAAQHHA